MSELTDDEMRELLRKASEPQEVSGVSLDFSRFPTQELEEKPAPKQSNRPKAQNAIAAGNAQKLCASKPADASPGPRTAYSIPQNTVEKPTAKKAIERGPAPLPFSEDALACQFTAHHGATLRYVSKWGRWLQWSGTVWQEESTLLPFDLARTVCRNNFDLPGATDPIKKTLAQAATVAAVVKLASADRQHAARHDQWDRDPMQLNTVTGTLDLRTGELHRHNSLDYLTKITAAGPSNEKPELWLQFLGRIFEDATIIPYLQRLCGYCLTGSTVEHALFFCYGSGKNGKSTFTRTLAGILNDYCREASLETFIESRNEQHPTGLAALKGARLALIRETEKNSYWAESQLKACTGGDRVTARYMRQDFFDYSPEFKLLISGNHKPRLRSVDEAIRRRMNLIPFAVTIPEDERDPTLYEKLRSEWPAILSWMVEGCLAWQQTGLAAPECVLSATSDYLQDEDKLGLWLAERCILGGRETASSAACYEDWKQWCASIGEHEGSQRAFSQELGARPGIRHEKGRDRATFIGLSLIADRPQESQQEQGE